MNGLDPKKEKVEIHHVQEKKQEYKFLGAARKKKGQTLYGLDTVSGEVYEVQFESQKTLDLSKGRNSGKYKALINPNHWLMWAINKKNAARKFANVIKKEFQQDQ